MNENVKVFSFLRNLLGRIFHRREKQEKIVSYRSHRVTYRYFLAVIAFFGLQSMVATFGALELAFPGMPTPVNAELGRAFHINVSVLWPLLGCMGAAYYFFCEEGKTELFSMRLAAMQFWLFVLTAGGLLASLVLGYLHGMEYSEAAWIFHAGIALTLILFFFNLLLTYIRSPERGRVTLLGFLCGAFLFPVLYLPNLYDFAQPTVNELVRFWVIHLWEELSKELILFAALVAVILKVTKLERKKLEKILFLQLALLIIGATFATGHHYYWIGVSSLWLWIGTIFSIVQVVSICILLYFLCLAGKKVVWGELDRGEKLSGAFFAAAVFYHILGAASLGMVIAVPRINFYSSATYLTSAHAHLALYGAIGMAVLGIAVYVLTRRAAFSAREYNVAWLGFVVNNAGLLVMGAALTLAGIIQTYLLRVIGSDFARVTALIRPYLLVRALGGATFAVGAFLFTAVMLRKAWHSSTR